MTGDGDESGLPPLSGPGGGDGAPTTPGAPADAPADGAPAAPPMPGGSANGPARAGLPSFPGMEVLEEVAPGVGGMGRVYRAREVSLERIVALKTAPLAMLTPEGRALVQREARAAARLEHPGIVKVYGFHPDHSPPYYVMQYVEGHMLEEACRGRDPAFVAALLEKAARALAYAHGKGMVHRDIKPANILVDYQGEPHLADFGLAHPWGEVEAAPQETVSREAGTPFFLAPELYLGDRDAGPAVDIYALGVTMYRLLTGRYPFTGRTREELRRSVLTDQPPLPQELNPAVPEPLQRICLKAMERRPEARYGSADALAEELRRLREGREVFARPTRYETALRGRLRNHVTEILQWREQHLLEVREMDRLVRPYHALLHAESPWHDLSLRFPWETVLLRLGGLMVIAGTILMPVVYWNDLTRLERVLAVGLPTAAMNLAGWLFLRRQSAANAQIFLSAGLLLVPVFLGLVLTQYELLRLPQPERWELFGREAVEGGDLYYPDGRTVREHVYLPTNAQRAVCWAVLGTYALVLWRATGKRIFAAWVGASAWLAFSAVLFLSGMCQWIQEEHVTWVLLWGLVFAVTFPGVATALALVRSSRAAPVLYAFFPIPLAALMTALAVYGSHEWFDADLRPDSETVNLWLMANGLAYLGLAVLSVRDPWGPARFWGGFFMVLVPVSLLVPANRLFDTGPALMQLGAAPLTTYKLATFTLSAGLAALGTRTRWHILAISGSIGLAVFLARMTRDHFLDHLSWPLFLLVTGGVAMTVALVLTFVRSRRRYRQLQ